jgi:hypothetical protein
MHREFNMLWPSAPTSCPPGAFRQAILCKLHTLFTVFLIAESELSESVLLAVDEAWLPLFRNTGTECDSNAPPADLLNLMKKGIYRPHIQLHGQAPQRVC